MCVALLVSPLIIQRGSWVLETETVAIVSRIALSGSIKENVPTISPHPLVLINMDADACLLSLPFLLLI